MNLYLVFNPEGSYDEYTFVVVAAEDPQHALGFSPVDLPMRYEDDDPRWLRGTSFDDAWPSPDRLRVELIGTAAPGRAAGILAAAFYPG